MMSMCAWDIWDDHCSGIGTEDSSESHKDAGAQEVHRLQHAKGSDCSSCRTVKEQGSKGQESSHTSAYHEGASAIRSLCWAMPMGVIVMVITTHDDLKLRGIARINLPRPEA